MNVKTKEIYSEVYQVLNLLGKEYIDKLPSSLIKMLEEKRQVDYIPQYTEDIPLNKQNMKKETISIIVLLYLNYWCESENEISEVKQILKNNEDKYHTELRERYNPDNIFKKCNHEHKEVDSNIKDTTSMILYKKSTFRRIITKIKSIFHIN